MRIAFNKGDPTSATLCARTWLCQVPLAAAQLPTAVSGDGGAPPSKRSGGGAQRKRKRKRAAALAAAGAAAAGAEARVVTAYGPMLLFDYVDSDVAVVVEQPWLRVMERFPPSLHRQQFGT